MNINIDVDKKIMENKAKIEEIKDLIPNLTRELRVLELRLRKLKTINLFLMEEKERI